MEFRVTDLPIIPPMNDKTLGLTLLGESGDVREMLERHGKMFQTMRVLSTAWPTTVSCANQLMWSFLLEDRNRNRKINPGTVNNDERERNSHKIATISFKK